MPATPSLLSSEESGSPGLWQLVRSHRLSVAAIVLLFAVAGAAEAFLTTPVYRATVVVLPSVSKVSSARLGAAGGELGSLGLLFGLGSGQTESTVEAVALLRSRNFGETFIRDQGLLRRLFASRWNASRSEWRTDWWSPTPPTLYDAFKTFDRKVRHVAEDKKTGLVTLDIDWTDADEGAEWGNEMIRRVNDEMRQRAVAEADASVQLLTNELRDATTVELRDAIARTLETYVESRTLAKVRPDYAFKIIDPAKAAGPKDFIRPQRALYLTSAPVIGFLFALFLILSKDFVQRQHEHATR